MFALALRDTVGHPLDLLNRQIRSARCLGALPRPKGVSMFNVRRFPGGASRLPSCSAPPFSSRDGETGPSSNRAVQHWFVHVEGLGVYVLWDLDRSV